MCLMIFACSWCPEMFGRAELFQSKANEAVRQAGHGTNTEFESVNT